MVIKLISEIAFFNLKFYYILFIYFKIRFFRLHKELHLCVLLSMLVLENVDNIYLAQNNASIILIEVTMNKLPCQSMARSSWLRTPFYICQLHDMFEVLQVGFQLTGSRVGAAGHFNY